MIFGKDRSAAGRINGKYGEVSWTPIRYVNRVYSRSVLAGLYRTARRLQKGQRNGFSRPSIPRPALWD